MTAGSPDRLAHSSSANGTPSMHSWPRPIASIAAHHAAAAAEPLVGERDEAQVRRRRRRGRAQRLRDLVLVAMRRQQADRDVGRGGRARHAGEAMDQHRLAAVPAVDEVEQRVDVVHLRPHLPRQMVEDVGHRDVEMASLARCRPAASTGVPGDSSVTSERAPVRATSASIRRANRRASAAWALLRRRVRRSGRGTAPAPPPAARARDRSQNRVRATRGAREEFARLAQREAGELRRLVERRVAVGGLDRLGEFRRA